MRFVWILFIVKPLKIRNNRALKKNILKDSKGYESKVGSNPDVTVEKGKIVLKGTGGGHKGKIHETGLNANDYLE